MGGYQGFINYFNKIIITVARKAFPSNIEKRGAMIVNLIKRHFNDRLLIIDEAHKLRGNGTKKNDNKKIKFILEMIA